MMTGSVRYGYSESGAIVLTPEPGMLKLMLSRPGEALLSIIACRRLPGPESFVFTTVNVAKGESSDFPLDPSTEWPHSATIINVVIAASVRTHILSDLPLIERFIMYSRFCVSEIDTRSKFDLEDYIWLPAKTV
jgi:hypothetical protein